MAQDGPAGEAPLQRRLFFVFKICEIVLAVFSLGLVIEPLRYIREADALRAGVALSACACTLLASGALLLGRVALGERAPPRTALLLALANGCLQAAAGAVMLDDWCRMYYRTYNLQPKLYLDLLIGSGVIAVFNAAAHLADAGATAALA